MPYRKNGRGDWRVKRSYRKPIAGKKIPKFDVPSGTKDYSEAVEVEKTLDLIARSMRVDGRRLLEDIAARRRTPLEVYALHCRQEAINVPDLGQAELLSDVWPRFVKSARKKNGNPISLHTKYDYAQYGKRLTELRPDAVVYDLPDLIKEYRDKLNIDTSVNDPKAKYHGHIRKVRAACLAFARNTHSEKQYSDLWRAISQIETAPVPTGNITGALRVFEVKKYIDALPSQQMKNIAWAMCLTGMGPLEYVGEWEVLPDRVKIDGTKTDHRKREVPLFVNITPEPFSYYKPGSGTLRNSVPGECISYKVFLKEVRRVSRGKITPYTFRHCFALWLEEAGSTYGIPDRRQSAYFGHKVTELRRKYAGHQWDTFLNEDAEKLQRYFRSEMEAPSQQRSDAVLELINL